MTKERCIAMDGKFRCAAWVLATVLALSGIAHATDDSAKGAARELANEAKGDFDAGNFEAAGSKFQHAYEIAKVPTLALWAARSLVKRGRMVAASELYRQAALLAPNDLWVGDAQQQAQADAERELGELQPRIPRLRIRVEGAAANEIEMTVNGAKMAVALLGIDLPTDPGRRHIVGKRGAEAVEQMIDLAEGDRKDTVLRFITAPPAPIVAEVPPAPAMTNQRTTPAPVTVEATAAAPGDHSQRTWGWVVAGVGAAGLLTGVVTGIAVMTNSGLRNDCPNGACPASKSGSAETYNLMRNISTAGFIVGGVGTALGVTLLLWTPKGEAEPRVALWLGPSSAGVKGAF
jgi:hypothetical protein